MYCQDTHARTANHALLIFCSVHTGVHSSLADKKKNYVYMYRYPYRGMILVREGHTRNTREINSHSKEVTLLIPS